MTITQKDIAQHLGVSQQAVSFALSGGGTISERTRGDILQAAQQLGYRRNEFARQMATGKSQMIGFLRHHHKHEQAGYMLEGVLDEADHLGYSVKVFRYRDGEIDGRTLERCAEMRLSGVVVLHCPPQMQAQIHEELGRYDIPVAILDNAAPLAQGIRVAGDDAQGIALAVEHLASLGHQDIAYLGAQSESGSAGARENGFLSAMQHCGLPAQWQPRRAHFTDFVPIEAAARELLQGAPRPTAIVCASDLMAMLVLRTARGLGLRVPQDLSVTGFDDLTMSAAADPALTTVAQSWEEMGRLAVRHLLGAGGANFIEELVSSRLVVRASTAPAPTF